MRLLRAGLLIMLLLGNAASAFPEEGLPAGKLLTLDEAFERVLNDNEGIRLLQIRLEKEQALLKHAKKFCWPYVRTSAYGAAVTQKDSGVLFWTNEIVFPVFDGWKARSEAQIHSVKKEQVKLEISNERERVQFEVRTLFIQTITEKEMTLLAQEWLKESERIYRSFKALHEKELITKREVYRAEALYKSAQYELVSHKKTMDYGVDLLRDLLKLPDDFRIDLEPLQDLKRFKPDLSQYSENPIYQEVKLRAQEKRLEEKRERSSLYPQISVLNRYKVAKDSFLDQNRYEFGVEGVWNIWDFGRTRDLVQAKRLEVEEAELQGEIEIKQFERQIKAMSVQLEVARKKIQADKAAEREKKEVYENEKTKMIVNEASRLQVFEAYQDYLKSRIYFIQGVANFRILEAKLEALKRGMLS